MTKHMVHIGNGAAILAETPDFSDPTDVHPREPQRARRSWPRIRSERQFAAIAENAARVTTYGPTTFAGLANDQCRYSVGDKIFCGLKVEERGRKVYCPLHEARSRSTP